MPREVPYLPYPLFFTEAMEGYSDIHCHVLYGVDDGARDIGRSLDMLSYMYDEGIRTVIMTPHYHAEYVKTGVNALSERFEKLCTAARSDSRLSTMRLYLGSEVHYFPSIIEWLDEGKVLTMAGSDYVLTEFSYSATLREITDGVSLLVNAGYHPVIAHLERCSELTDDLDGVRHLIEMGAYVQVNTESLYTGLFRRSFAVKLLKNDMVHFVATDAHGIRHRAPLMADAARFIIRHCGQDACDRILCDNPSMMIDNEII